MKTAIILVKHVSREKIKIQIASITVKNEKSKKRSCNINKVSRIDVSGPSIPVRRIVHRAIMKRFSNEIDIAIRWNLVTLVVQCSSKFQC
jgi:hypothetical protein